jgi:pimeloyl-ACP methyl ester carboxylesterase
MMATQVVDGVRLYHEEHGAGAPIALIHGCGGSALGFADAVEKLARLGRVIAYDRRGCARSERPEPYERTSVAEHADDAAALLDALAATPAIVIGRSYGGTVASDLALRYPDRVQALVLLEPDAPRELAPAAAKWVDALGDHLRTVAARFGIEAIGEALITEVAGENSWRSFPDEWRRVITGNGPAILAELAGEWWLQADRPRHDRAARPTRGSSRLPARVPPAHRSASSCASQRADRAGRRRSHHRSRGAGSARLHRGGTSPDAADGAFTR